MMSVDENSRKLRQAYERWNATKGTDLTMWDEHVTDDICIRSLGRGEHGLTFSCTRRGRPEMHAYLKELTDTFEMQHWTLQETIAQGDQVVGLGLTAWTCRATGKTAETPVVVICRFRDGLVCEYQEFYDTAAISAATT